MDQCLFRTPGILNVQMGHVMGHVMGRVNNHRLLIAHNSSRQPVATSRTPLHEHLLQQWRGATQLSRVKVPKSAGINDTIMPSNTDLKFGSFGIRAITGKRVSANTIEAVRRTLRRKLKREAKLWIRIEATVPVTRKPDGIRMGKGKGAIAFYATPVRPGQILFEMDRISRAVAYQAMVSIQAKFPCRLGFVEWR
ncbi:hypothetical protein CEUSTIGMA_g9396.t1 [Chlamydomonas eustigma]|uniref:Ribosomal protein L10e/L16 domain-containing protein n=1 Tax=Chlamydomonas eustigma TaxID=1157962 RepID=A0A250XFW1_9CHLO|nr:hypothetical protein CEUSTIGMA_g9396.t1 [Chlamydomonas eustigma]|eukprot:GAX81968.1 hypothetical protein CEUSTIGMA_g9396.t1 [Chlamydomonas eustigma]